MSRERDQARRAYTLIVPPHYLLHTPLRDTASATMAPEPELRWLDRSCPVNTVISEILTDAFRQALRH
jgi:hypothetical protein